MIVNDVNLKTKYGSKVIWLKQEVKPRNVVTYTNWLDNAHDPVKYRENRYTDFEIYMDMLIKGSTKEECEKIMSNLMNDFDSGILQLDNMNFLYKFDFKIDNREIVRRWLYHYEITLSGYAKMGTQESLSFTGTTYAFNVKGTAKTPAVLYLSSDIGLNYLTISGMTDEPITVNNVELGSQIVIDGEQGIITENSDNIAGKCDFWEFPALKPGTVQITLSSSCTAELKYYPRYK